MCSNWQHYMVWGHLNNCIVRGILHDWPPAGFAVWYQASDSWVGLVAFGVPIVVMTAALHAGVRIRYLPEVR